MLTIYDIAKIAGVSPSTVSRVLNNKEGVKKETRKKVEAIINENNFVVNQNARGLVMQATKLVGILVADIRTIHHTEGAYIIERELFKKGYSCLVFNTSNSEEAQLEYIRILSTRNVEAAVLMGSVFQKKCIKDAIEKYLNNIPIIMINGYFELSNVYGILTDDYNAVKNLVKHLSEYGKKNSAFVLGQHTESNYLKQKGYMDGVQEYLPTKQPIVIETEDDDYQGAYYSTYNLIKNYPGVDSIIYSVDLLAAIGLHALRDLNLNIPKDISIYGIDNSIYAQITNPQLSSVDTKTGELSILAARTIMLALDQEVVSHKLIVPSTFIERQSTPN